MIPFQINQFPSNPHSLFYNYTHFGTKIFKNLLVLKILTKTSSSSFLKTTAAKSQLNIILSLKV